jgi:hypothetical protein
MRRRLASLDPEGKRWYLYLGSPARNAALAAPGRSYGTLSGD